LINEGHIYIVYSERKKEFSRIFCGFCYRVKHRTLRKGPNWKRVPWKTNGTIYNSISKMVQSDTKATTFKWLFIKPLLLCSNRFCASEEVQSLKTILSYYKKTYLWKAWTSFRINLNIRKKILIFSFVWNI